MKDRYLTRREIFWFCIATGIFCWVFDAFIEARISYKFLYNDFPSAGFIIPFRIRFIEQLIAPDISVILMRFLYIGIIMMFYFFSTSLIAQSINIPSNKRQDNLGEGSQLIHANHMTILGSLINGTVHDFKNPNSVITSNTPLLIDIWSDFEKILRECNPNYDNLLIGGFEFNDAVKTVPLLLNGINESSKKMDNIVNGLREFSNLKDTFPNSLADINDIISYCVSLMSFGLYRSVETLNMELSPNLPKIKGSRINTILIIMNLLQNSITSLNTENNVLSIATNLKNDGKYVILKICDNGRGITESELQKIFEPFYTTNRKDKNLGLGLYTINTLLKEIKGTIKVNSQPGIGTTIIIEFPIIES